MSVMPKKTKIVMCADIRTADHCLEYSLLQHVEGRGYERNLKEHISVKSSISKSTYKNTVL